MFQFFQSNSLIFIGLFLQVLAGWYFLRNGLNRGNILRWLVVAALLAIGVFGMRPTGISSADPAEIKAMLGQGTPVLIEFKSPN